MISILPHWLTFFTALTIAFVSIVSNLTLGGEMLDIPLSIELYLVILLYLINVLLLFTVLFTVKILTKKSFRCRFIARIDLNKFITFFSVIVLFNIIFTYYTGAGVLFREAETSFSFLSSIFNPGYIFPLFYIYCRNKVNKIMFYALTAFYAVSELQKGWTGFLLSIFFIEVYFYLKNKNTSKKIFVCVLTPLVVLAVGALMYQLVYPLKQSVRFGEGDHEITYLEALELLSSRLTFFPVGVAGFQEADAVRDFYLSEGVPLKESLGFFKPILPGFIMGDKSFRSLNNNVKQPFWDVDSSSSTDMGIFTFIYILSCVAPIDLIILLLIALLSIFILKYFYDMISEYKGQFDIVIYFVVFSIFYTFSPEHVFSRNFLSIFYLFPLMVGLRICRVYRNTHIVR